MSNLIFSATGTDVLAVFVDGKPLVWQREFLHLDEEKIVADILAMMRKADHLLTK
jgi:5-methylthioadenosine/S-adenosylhomocysteine deaminase